MQHHGRASSHRPELILNNFGTRLGHRLGRMFASIFSQDPNFKGRRAVTFHNQRDYIFFRQAQLPRYHVLVNSDFCPSNVQTMLAV